MIKYWNFFAINMITVGALNLYLVNIVYVIRKYVRNSYWTTWHELDGKMWIGTKQINKQNKLENIYIVYILTYKKCMNTQPAYR